MFLGNEILQVKIEVASDNFIEDKIPIKAYPKSAGYDLFAAENGLVLSNLRTLINTGIKMSIPKGYYGQISPQSGLALNKGIIAFSGTIDSGYLGYVYVLLFNFSDKEFSFRRGDRITQIIFKKCESVSFSTDRIVFDSERGVNAFGSSGLVLKKWINL